MFSLPNNHDVKDNITKEQLISELKYSNRLLSNVIEFYPDATVIIDSQGRIIAWNKAMEEISGIKAEDMVGKDEYEYAIPFHGERRPVLINMVELPLLEIRKRYKDIRVLNGKIEAISLSAKVKGHDLILWGTASKLYGSDGSVIGAIESIRDITGHMHALEELRRHRDHLEELVGERTVDLMEVNEELQCEIAERKLAEEELRKSEKFLKNTFDCIQDGISIFDKDLNIIRVNPTIEKRFPHMRPVVGKKCYTAYHCRDEPCENCPSIMAINEKTPKNSVVPIEGLKGLVDRWMELFSFPLFDDDGNVVGVIEYSRDITDRRRAEEALRESEEKFRVLAETSSVGIFLYQDDRFVYVNPAIEALLGYTNDEFLNARFWDFSHPDFREVMKERGLARLRGEQVQSCYEIKYATKSGEEGWAELSAGLIEYKGKPAGIAILYDITRRKHAEKELESAKAQAELYLDLMGHDINNLNQVGIGFLELALDTMSLTEDGRSLLSKPLAALESSSRLIDNVRKLQKARSGELRRQETDVGKVLHTVQQYYSHIPGRSVTINYTPVSGCIVMADELLYDVFSNLVGNAIKHSTRTPLISIKVEKAIENEKCYHKIIVEDNGPGISDDLKPKIFNRHIRGNTKAKGSGIGLYLVKTLVENYGGRVCVEDRVHGDMSKGSRFIVLLPAYGPS